MFIHIHIRVREDEGVCVDEDEEDDDDTNDGFEVNFGSMRSTIHNIAMKFKPVIQRYRDEWRSHPNRKAFSDLRRECRKRFFSIWGVTLSTNAMYSKTGKFERNNQF